jgi:hypothetical protein
MWQSPKRAKHVEWMQGNFPWYTYHPLCKAWKFRIHYKHAQTTYTEEVLKTLFIENDTISRTNKLRNYIGSEQQLKLRTYIIITGWKETHLKFLRLRAWRVRVMGVDCCQRTANCRSMEDRAAHWLPKRKARKRSSSQGIKTKGGIKDGNASSAISQRRVTCCFS